MDSELLLIGVTTINGYVSQNTDTACYYTKNHLLKFIHLLVGGQHIKLTDKCKQAENVWIIRKFHHFK